MTSAPTRQLPMAQPDIGPRERELVEQVLQSDTLALGPMAIRFEEAIAAIAERRYAVSCSSGTAGLHMAVRGLGIGDGDEVITTPFSFIASANCILYERAVPRFVDIDEDTLGLDPALAESAAGPRTVAILPVHVFGRPCQIEDTSSLAKRRGWHLIEDACEALGSRSVDRALGSYGNASVFAFYPNKQITTGEGGVVVTDDPDLAATCRSLRNQGRDTGDTWLRHVRLGYNYRMDELSAALGVAQLERHTELRAARRQAAEAYSEMLQGHPLISIPEAGVGESVDWFVYVVRLHANVDRTAVMEDLLAAGIPSRPYFQPLHLQPLYRKTLGHVPGDFPVTERVAASTLALPWSTRLPRSDIQYVSEHLVAAVERQARA